MNKYTKFGLFLAILFLIVLVWAYPIDFILLKWYNFGGILFAIILVAFVAPAILKPIYLLWMFIGHWLGIINTYIIFTAIYFIIITPMSIISKLFIRKNQKLNSNWTLTPGDEPINFNKQF